MLFLLLFNSVVAVIYANVFDVKSIVVVILSQRNTYHKILAENFRNDVVQQAKNQFLDTPKIHLLHEDFSHVGAWTIIPIISKLAELHETNSSWFLFVEDFTKIRVSLLVDLLNNYNAKEKIWLGYALHDEEASIIHHFAFYDNPKSFSYPYFGSGFAISNPLLLSLNERILNKTELSSDFSIDKAFELALFIWDNSKGYALQHEKLFCTISNKNCATFPQPFKSCDNFYISINSIYFAVKTCSQFHQERVKVIKNTWAKYVLQLDFFSDVADDSIPTISLGIPNTESGHCGKTLAILRYVNNKLKNLSQIQWIVLVDDDTILSVSKLVQYLSCFNSSTSVCLGERYGYNVYNSLGFNYITGGGGIVFSKYLLEKLVEFKQCNCPSNDSPDDMYLGQCVSGLGVDITHSPLFHQARPMDYSVDLLKTQKPISFHKHWMTDPVNIYKEWFEEDDIKLKSNILHNEL